MSQAEPLPAIEARVTMAQIKALNKRLAVARTRAEKDSLSSLVAAAKADWWCRTEHYFHALRAEQDVRP